jgi:hypothetical protein
VLATTYYYWIPHLHFFAHTPKSNIPHLLQAVKKNLSDIWKEEDPNYKFPQFYPGKMDGKAGEKSWQSQFFDALWPGPGQTGRQ